MRYVKLLIEYDGTEYHGWQSQRFGMTIQDVLREKIYTLTGEEARLTASSRTDAGVHALGQVAVIETESSLSPEVISRALNATLPADIRILDAEEASAEFHPRFSAKGKSYFYIISNTPLQSAFLHRWCWNVRCVLDLDAMRRAASALVGRHDFSSFKGSGCSSKTQVRTVASLELTRLDRLDFMTSGIKGDFIKIRIEADAFLRHMVRNIAGTLVEVGKGKFSADGIGALIEARDRTSAGPTAPPQGLFLEEVYY